MVPDDAMASMRLYWLDVAQFLYEWEAYVRREMFGRLCIGIV